MMKTLFIALLCALTATNASNHVYCTDKGAKYHTHKDCRYLKGKEVKELSVADAQKQGKTICKVCQVKDIINH